VTRFHSILCGCALVLAVAGGDAHAQKAPGAAAPPDAATVERRLLEAKRKKKSYK